MEWLNAPGRSIQHRYVQRGIAVQAAPPLGLNREAARGVSPAGRARAPDSRIDVSRSRS